MLLPICNGLVFSWNAILKSTVNQSVKDLNVCNVVKSSWKTNQYKKTTKLVAFWSLSE